MLETQTLQRHTVVRYTNKQADTSPNPSSVSYNVETLSNESSFEENAETVKGDHIIALPYWSNRGRIWRPATPVTLRSCWGSQIVNGRQTYPGWSEWPWVPIPVQNGFSTEINMQTWDFDLMDKIAVPKLTHKTPDPAILGLLTRIADTKALGNVRKALVNFPLLIAERRETLQMIGGKVNLMAKAVRAAQDRSLLEFKKTKPRNRAAVAKRISNEHLEIVFGMLPLIAEVEGALELIEDPRLLFVRSRGVAANPLVDTVKSVTPLAPKKSFNGTSALQPWADIHTSTTTRDVLSVRTALRYKLESQWVGDAARMGFDPISAGFDLIPLSFVTGWFSNFDYWIKSLTPFFGMDFQTGSRNVRQHMEYSQKALLVPRSTYNTRGPYEKAEPSGHSTKDVRVSLSKAPESSLEWDVEFGLYEVAAGISLTLQRVLKPLKSQLRQKEFRYKGPRPKWLKTIRYTGRS